MGIEAYGLCLLSTLLCIKYWPWNTYRPDSMSSEPTRIDRATWLLIL